MNQNTLNERVSELQAAIEATQQAAALLELAKSPKLARNVEQRKEAWSKLSSHAAIQAGRINNSLVNGSAKARSHKRKLPTVAAAGPVVTGAQA